MHHHHNTNRNQAQGGFIVRHLVLLIVLIAIAVGVYLLTRNATAVSTSAILFIVVHLAIGGGMMLGGRRLLGRAIQKIHGTPATHSHAHDSLETQGVTISWARFYDVLVRFIFVGQQRKLIQSVIRLAQIQQGEKVLDVGCGTGTLAIATKRNAPADVEIYGRDASPEMIHRAQQKAQDAGVTVNFEPGLVEDVAFADETFDLVMNSLMVHHLPGDLKARAFAEMYRVLKPGGRLLIVDFEPPKSRIKRTILRLFVGQGMMLIDNNQIPPLLTAAGFTDMRITSTDSSLATAIQAIKPS